MAFKDEAWNFIGDPGGYITGVNKGGFSGLKDIAEGHPGKLKDAYDKLIAESQRGGQDIKNFLLGQQAKAQQYFGPVQTMFNKMYGTGGIAAPQTPTAPGITQSMYQQGK